MGYEMARGEARTWNYMSDFELDITLQQDGEAMTIPEGVPFVVTVTGACGEYRASYNGRRYINCATDGDTIRVFCNNHMLGVGRLMVDVWLKYEDVNYPDGKDIHLVEDTGCALVRGNGNADGSMKVELALQYAVVTAYEVATAKGYKGTEEAFYKSLAEVTDNSTAAKEAAETAKDAAIKAETAASKAKEAAAKAEDAAASATETAATVSAEVAAEVKASKQVRETLQAEEAGRETAENARVLSEQERRNAETKRATDFANAISATETAGAAAKKTAEDAAAKADAAATNANGIYTTVRAAYGSGEFKGEKGDKGDTGDKGADGENVPTLTASSLCYSATGNGDKCYIIINGTKYGVGGATNTLRGINLFVFDKSDFSLQYFKNYDTYGDSLLADEVAEKMDEYTDHIVVLIADDACACTQTLRDKIAAYGGKTEGVWTAANYSWYFVGMAGLASGQGYETYYFGGVQQTCTIPLIPGKGFVLNGAKGEAGGYLPVYEHGGGETLLTLDTNTEHRWTEVPSLKLTFGAVSDNTIGNEIRVAFKSGDTATTVTLPAGIVWAVPFVVPTNALVEMSFTYVGGKWLGVWTSFDV